MARLDESTADGRTLMRQTPASAEAQTANAALARKMRRRGEESRFWWLVPTIYIIFLMLPIYWLINMSFKTNQEILGAFSLWPRNPTIANYMVIFTDPSWYKGYINSIIYVVMNTVISVAVALPAAYAFSRYRFLGDKHLFFWLLTNRMAPPAVFALPWRSRTACSTCRWRSGFSRASCRACRRKSTRPPISTAIPSRASSSGYSCR
jgi:glycerol transport system permease protein